MEETMKCLKNTKTGSIIRVSDTQAHQMAGNQWKYVPKSEWRGIERTKPVEEPVVVGHDQGGSYEVKTEKKYKKKVS
jgi:hypothetical protein